MAGKWFREWLEDGWWPVKKGGKAVIAAASLGSIVAGTLNHHHSWSHWPIWIGIALLYLMALVEQIRWRLKFKDLERQSYKAPLPRKIQALADLLAKGEELYAACPKVMGTNVHFPPERMKEIDEWVAEVKHCLPEDRKSLFSGEQGFTIDAYNTGDKQHPETQRMGTRIQILRTIVDNQIEANSRITPTQRRRRAQP